MTSVLTWEQFLIFFSREGMRKEVGNIKKIQKILWNTKKVCQKDKGIIRWALEGYMRNYWQILQGQQPSADIVLVTSTASENWFFHIWSKIDKLSSKYYKKQFQQQLEVPLYKQTLLHNGYVMEKYFTLFL